MTTCATAALTANASAPFAFGTLPIRISVDEKGIPWFAAKDVFAALGLPWNGRKTLAPVPASWQGVVSFNTPSNDDGHGGGKQKLIVINEPAVYKLAFRSNKPEADRFTNWVASEVIPAIRRQGAYAPPQAALPAVTVPADPETRDRDRLEQEFLMRRLRALKHEMLEVSGDLYRSARRATRRCHPRGECPERLFLTHMNEALDNVLDAMDRDLDALDQLCRAGMQAARVFF